MATFAFPDWKIAWKQDDETEQCESIAPWKDENGFPVRCNFEKNHAMPWLNKGGPNHGGNGWSWN